MTVRPPWTAVLVGGPLDGIVWTSEDLDIPGPVIWLPVPANPAILPADTPIGLTTAAYRFRNGPMNLPSRDDHGMMFLDFESMG